VVSGLAAPRREHYIKGHAIHIEVPMSSPSKAIHSEAERESLRQVSTIESPS